MNEEEKVEYSRISIHRDTKEKTKIEIISKKGGRLYKFDIEKKDRLFFIRLTNLQDNKQIEIPYKYEDQIKLMDLVFDNIILDYIFDREISKFQVALNNIKKRRKNGGT